MLGLSCRIGHAKPEADAYRWCLERMGAAGEVLFVDDNRSNVEAARALGLRGHVFTSVPELRRRWAAPEDPTPPVPGHDSGVELAEEFGDLLGLLVQGQVPRPFDGVHTRVEEPAGRTVQTGGREEGSCEPVATGPGFRPRPGRTPPAAGSASSGYGSGARPGSATPPRTGAPRSRCPWTVR